MEIQIPAIFATKGVEYLIAIGYLLLLVPIWFALRQLRRAAAPPREAVRPGDWRGVPQGTFIHPGHAWVRPTADGLLRVGVDGFAYKLIGDDVKVELPEVGTWLQPGGKAWQLVAGDELFPMLAPVAGQVVRSNPQSAAAEDPYGGGWLLEVEPETRPALDGLLTGDGARTWLTSLFDDLQQRAGGNEAVLQDGGEPISGFAKVVEPDDWADLARRYLLIFR
jgi:glycine cleavage system H lipoate-binding protein